MADERFVVMTVKCEHCGTEQVVRVAARTGFAQMGDQSIPCINCKKDFDVMVPDRIIGGPFANIKEAVAIVKDWVKNP